MPDQILTGSSVPESGDDLATLAYAVAMLPALAPKKLEALPAALAAASQIVRDHCRRDFRLTPRDERHDGDGFDLVVLRHYPAASIEAVTLGKGADAEELAADEWDFDPQYGTLRLEARVFPAGFRNVRVRYTAGLAAPDPVRQATVQVARALIDQAANNSMIDGERWGDFMQYRNVGRMDFAIPETAKGLLAPYRDFA